MSQKSYMCTCLQAEAARKGSGFLGEGLVGSSVAARARAVNTGKNNRNNARVAWNEDADT